MIATCSLPPRGPREASAIPPRMIAACSLPPRGPREAGAIPPWMIAACSLPPRGPREAGAIPPWMIAICSLPRRVPREGIAIPPWMIAISSLPRRVPREGIAIPPWMIAICSLPLRVPREGIAIPSRKRPATRSKLGPLCSRAASLRDQTPPHPSEAAFRWNRPPTGPRGRVYLSPRSHALGLSLLIVAEVRVLSEALFVVPHEEPHLGQRDLVGAEGGLGLLPHPLDHVFGVVLHVVQDL
jgi:hypothetical protein